MGNFWYAPAHPKNVVPWCAMPTWPTPASLNFFFRLLQCHNTQLPWWMLCFISQPMPDLPKRFIWVFLHRNSAIVCKDQWPDIGSGPKIFEMVLSFSFLRLSANPCPHMVMAENVWTYFKPIKSTLSSYWCLTWEWRNRGIEWFFIAMDRSPYSTMAVMFFFTALHPSVGTSFVLFLSSLSVFSAVSTDSACMGLIG